MYYVYILTNKSDKVMYIGVTNNLQRRLYEHKNELVEGFTKKYHIHKLVYYESYKEVKDAILREKRLKGLLRIRKNELVETMNPAWNDLSEILFPNVFTQIRPRSFASLKDDTGEGKKDDTGEGKKDDAGEGKKDDAGERKKDDTDEGNLCKGKVIFEQDSNVCLQLLGISYPQE